MHDSPSKHKICGMNFDVSLPGEGEVLLHYVLLFSMRTAQCMISTDYRAKQKRSQV